MSKENEISPFVAEMIEGLNAFAEALESGEPIEKKFTVRDITLDLHPKSYTTEDVKRVRRTLNVSQPLFARFLGVSVKTLRSWEQGIRPVPPIAARFMDEIVANPDLLKRRMSEAVTTEPRP